MAERYEGDQDRRTLAEEGRFGAEPGGSWHEDRQRTPLDRYRGFDWLATFLGFAVATFFTTVLLGIVGVIVGSVGYQLGAEVPQIGGSISGATQRLGLGAVGGSILALIVAYFIGGYTAGRLARYDGMRNGAGIVAWAVLFAIILGALGALLGSRFNVSSQLHLNVSLSSLSTAGLISLALTLLVTLVAAGLGGWLGGHYHKRVDRAAGLYR